MLNAVSEYQCYWPTNLCNSVRNVKSTNSVGDVKSTNSVRDTKSTNYVRDAKSTNSVRAAKGTKSPNTVRDVKSTNTLMAFFTPCYCLNNHREMCRLSVGRLLHKNDRWERVCMFKEEGILRNGLKNAEMTSNALSEAWVACAHGSCWGGHLRRLW